MTSLFKYGIFFHGNMYCIIRVYERQHPTQLRYIILFSYNTDNKVDIILNNLCFGAYCAW